MRIGTVSLGEYLLWMEIFVINPETIHCMEAFVGFVIKIKDVSFTMSGKMIEKRVFRPSVSHLSI